MHSQRPRGSQEKGARTLTSPRLRGHISPAKSTWVARRLANKMLLYRVTRTQRTRWLVGVKPKGSRNSQMSPAKGEQRPLSQNQKYAAAALGRSTKPPKTSPLHAQTLKGRKSTHRRRNRSHKFSKGAASKSLALPSTLGALPEGDIQANPDNPGLRPGCPSKTCICPPG